MMRSPSQCPGTALSSTSEGRSLIMTMPGIRPRVSSRPWGRLFARPDRKHRVAQLASALDEQGLVDRFVAHPHHRIVWVLEAQPLGDLSRRPPFAQAPGHLGCQLRDVSFLGFGRRDRWWARSWARQAR